MNRKTVKFNRKIISQKDRQKEELTKKIELYKKKKIEEEMKME
jgi:hypothetical protein